MTRQKDGSIFMRTEYVNGFVKNIFKLINDKLPSELITQKNVAYSIKIKDPMLMSP